MHLNAFLVLFLPDLLKRDEQKDAKE